MTRLWNRLRPWPRRLALWAADYATIAAWQLRGLLIGPGPTGAVDAADPIGAGPTGATDGIALTGRAEDTGRAPVVLLPGVYETWAVFAGFVAELERRGHPVYAVRTLGYNHGPVEEMSRRAARLVFEADLRDVVLVAHSKGGLIGKSLMLDPDVEPRVAGMVAVAAPFEGSAYARWIPLRAVRSLAPDDAGIRSLGAHLQANARIVSVYAQFDPHIPGGSHLPGAAANIEVATTGHFRILAHPRARGAVLDAVEDLGAPHGGTATRDVGQA